MTITYTGPGIYWGVGGEYGPFEEQKTGEWAGWPDFGQVLRYFRRKARMSPKEFGEIYFLAKWVWKTIHSPVLC